MYERFYDLTSDPFRLSPRLDSCFEHSSFRRAKAYMNYVYGREEGIFMLTGEPGTGKSSLIRSFVADRRESAAAIHEIVAVRLEANDLLDLIARRLDIAADGGGRGARLIAIERRLVSLRDQGQRALLIVDEAQSLGNDALEELRGLTNLQANGVPLLQVFLIGQASLREKVKSADLEQLHQRVIAAARLTALDESEVVEYLDHALRVSGWRGDRFLDDYAYSIIYEATLGVPRKINLVGSRILLRGYVREHRALGLEDVESVLRDLRREELLPDVGSEAISRDASVEAHDTRQLRSASGGD